MTPPVIKLHYRSNAQIAEQLSLRHHPDQLGVILIVRMRRLAQGLGFLFYQIFDLACKIRAQPLGQRRQTGLQNDLNSINAPSSFERPSARNTNGAARFSIHNRPLTRHVALHKISEKAQIATSTHICWS